MADSREVAGGTVPDVASPCVGICCVDATGVCIGCFRTVDELAAWFTASDAEKLRILGNCRARRQGKPVPSRP